MLYYIMFDLPLLTECFSRHSPLTSLFLVRPDFEFGNEDVFKAVAAVRRIFVTVT